MPRDAEHAAHVIRLLRSADEGAKERADYDVSPPEARKWGSEVAGSGSLVGV